MAPCSTVFLYIDLDEYFVQVERIAAPQLRGRPLLVGGLPGGGGVVACASREARLRGVRAGTPIVRALRLCPEAVVLPCHPMRIHDLSRRFLLLLLGRTPRVEPRSLDEVLVDASGLVRSLDDGIALGRSIQEELACKLGLAASIGIAPARGIARIACTEAKPAGRLAWDVNTFHERLGDAPVDRLPGLGPIHVRELARSGIRTLGQLRYAADETILQVMGKRGLSLRAAVRGEDREPIPPFDPVRTRRTRERSFTFPRPLERKAHLRRVLVGIGEEIAGGLRSDRARAAWLTVVLIGESGERMSQRIPFDPPTDVSVRILRALERCLDPLDRSPAIRAMTIRVHVTKLDSAQEQDLFSKQEDSLWDEATDRIIERFGRRSLVRAVFLPSRGKG